MAHRKKKNKNFKIIFYLPIIIIIAYLVFSLFSAKISVKKKEQELQELQKQVSEQTLINEELQKELDQSESDEYIEKKAHENGMAYPGEKIYLPRQS